MSTVQGLRAGLLAGVLIGMTLSAGPISAQVSAYGIGVGTAQGTFSTERPGSVLIFPKVVNTNPDTIIQIANTSNSVTHAKCFYTDGREIGGEPVWQVTDFEMVLTRQQPTHWAVSRGRAVVPWPIDMNPQTSGLDPGLIPPVPTGFTGSLVCVETTMDGTPLSANSLKGEATIGQVNGPMGVNNVSKYNAIAIPACVSGVCGPVPPGETNENDGDNILELDNIEYAACPGGQYLNFIAEGASNPAIDGAGNVPSVVSTNLTAVPCGFDFENSIPLSTRIAMPIRNEFEENLSANPFEVTCWFSETIGGPPFGAPPSPLALGGLGTTFGKAIIRPLAPSFPPVIAVANSLHTGGDQSSDTAAMNLPFCTEPSAPSLCVPFNSEIRLPTIK